MNKPAYKLLLSPSSYVYILRISHLFLYLGFLRLRRIQPYLVKLHSSRIGHLIYNHEMFRFYLSKLNRSDFKAIVICNSLPANLYIYSLFRKSLPSFHHLILPYPFSTLVHRSSSLLKKIGVIHLPFAAIHPRAHNASSELPPYYVPKTDHSLLHNYLSKYHLQPHNYVSFHNRDSSYLAQLPSSDPNFHDYRDFDVDNLAALSHHLESRGLRSVRHGHTQLPATSSLFPQSFLDLSRQPDSTGSRDILLISQSLFFVGCSTGMSLVPFLFRKPTLLVNYVPSRLDELCIFPSNSIYIPKLIIENSTGRPLSFREIFTLPYNIHTTTCPFTALGLTLVPNTSEDILEAGKQMLAQTTGTFSPDYQDLQLLENFWSSVSDITGATHCRQLSIAPPFSFLRKYHHLI